MICDVYICVFEYFSDECGLLANVSKCSSFGGGGVCIFVSSLVWFCLGFGIFHGWNGKEDCIGCYG